MKPVDLDALLGTANYMYKYLETDAMSIDLCTNNVYRAHDEIKYLRQENEKFAKEMDTTKKDFLALFQGRSNDYNNRISALEDENEKLWKVAEAAKVLIDQCPNIYMETDGEQEFLEIALRELEDKT
jgi:hypothetical protein